MDTNNTSKAVRQIIAFFEGLEPTRSVITEPSQHIINDSAAVELPANQQSDASDQGPLGPSLSFIKSRYFDKKPINNWMICQELRQAMSEQAPLHYQKQLLNLLTRQVDAMDKLCIGVDGLAHQPTIYSHTKEKSSETAHLELFNTVTNFCKSNIATLFNKKIDHTKNKQRQAMYTNTSTVLPSNKSVEPNNKDIQGYPELLINIIEEFLMLVESKDYQLFLKSIIDKKCDLFNRLTDEEANFRLYKLPDEQTIQLFQTLSKTKTDTMTRKQINEQFKRQLMDELHSLPISRRKALNQEFRGIIRIVLYTLLLTIRKEQSLSSSWNAYNPLKLISPLPKQWILSKVSLTPYLKREDSDHPKELPIEHPINISYSLVTQKETTRNNKVNDALDWIARVERCGLDPLGSIPKVHHQIDNIAMNNIFASTKSFIGWLRQNPSISLIYSRETDEEANQILSAENWRIEINIADIQPVKDDYFTKLYEIVSKRDSMTASHRPCFNQ